MKKIFAKIKSLCNIVFKSRTIVLIENENRYLKGIIKEYERSIEEKSNYKKIPEVFLESNRTINLKLDKQDKFCINKMYEEYDEGIRVIEKIILHERNKNAAIASDMLRTQDEVLKAQSLIAAYSHIYRVLVTKGEPENLLKRK